MDSTRPLRNRHHWPPALLLLSLAGCAGSAPLASRTPLEAGTGGHGVETMQQGIDGIALGLTFLLSRLHPAHTPVDERGTP